MLYYINCFFFYSLMGFIMESDVFKIQQVNVHSGIYYGPVTTVYGFGIIALLLIKKYIFEKLKCNKLFKLLITFILCITSLTLIEFIGGNTLKILFNIDMWNYTKKQFNFGKYICLELSLAWGVMGCFFIYYGINFFNRFIKVIPKWFTYLITIIHLIDTSVVLFNSSCISIVTSSYFLTLFNFSFIVDILL